MKISENTNFLPLISFAYSESGVGEPDSLDGSQL